jgi:flagellar FliL protein
MKKLIIIFAVLLMLGGATVSVLKVLKMGPFAPAPDDASSEGGVHEAPPEPPRFVEVAQMYVPIFAGDSVATTIQIQIKLETPDEESEATLVRMMPRLNDAFLRYLYSSLPRLLSKDERLDVAVIKRRLQSVADKIVGPGLVENVLVQSVTDTSRVPAPAPK